MSVIVEQNLEIPLDMLREEIAAMLLNRDEGGNVIVWARRQIVQGKDAPHDGDCTKQCYTCCRCVADGAMADADQLISRVLDACEPVTEEMQSMYTGDMCALWANERHWRAMLSAKRRQLMEEG